MAYKRKTKDEYQLHIDYGYGWECVTIDETLKEARQMQRDYMENCPQYPSRIVKKRVPIKEDKPEYPMTYLRGSETTHETVELRLPDGDTCVINVYHLLKCGWRSFPCGSGNDHTLNPAELEKAKHLINSERKKLTSKEIKSMADWSNSGLENFDDFFFPGDKVAEDVVEYYTNIMPPVTFSRRLVQAGEAHDTLPESSEPEAKWHNTYMTFAVKDGSWVYVGNCFEGETVARNREEIFSGKEQNA